MADAQGFRRGLVSSCHGVTNLYLNRTLNLRYLSQETNIQKVLAKKPTVPGETGGYEAGC